MMRHEHYKKMLALTHCNVGQAVKDKMLLSRTTLSGFVRTRLGQVKARLRIVISAMNLHARVWS